MNILAIDPGTTESAWLVMRDGQPVAFGKDDNAHVLNSIAGNPYPVESNRRIHVEHLAIEMVQSFGMPVGEEVFETVLWAGRFIEAFSPRPHTRIYRSEVKLHLCHSARAKDGNVRQALIDKFGGKSAAVGNKRTPGPLYGVANDVWSALAVAVTWMETRPHIASFVGGNVLHVS